VSQVRGARASRTQCLASRQTHSGPLLSKRGQSKEEPTGRNEGRSGARDAPHGDRDDRAPQSLQRKSTENVEKPKQLERRLTAGFRRGFLGKPSATRRSVSSARPSDFFVLHPEPAGRSFPTCRAAGKAYDLRRHQETNEGTKSMGGRKGIGQKEQTQPDLGPAGLVQETLLNRCIRMADREPVCVI